MASYRYERDIDPKDLKPRKQRQYSRRERWANWWDYNLKWVLIFGIAGAFVAYCFIGQYFFTTHPDYNIAVVSPYYLPEATVTALQQQLAAYGEDCNGDGKVVVKLNQYTMAFNSEDSDAYLDMAGTTKLSTDIQSSLSSIFILYDPAGFQQTTGTLRYLDGRLPKSDADSDWWNMVYRWTDCPVLTGMELGSYTSDAVQSASGDSQQLLAVAAGALHRVRGVAAQLHPGQHRAVRPAVDHVPPVAVGVGLGQTAVQIPQSAGGLLEACGVVEDKDGTEGTLDIGGKLGGARHIQISVRVLTVESHGVLVQLHHHLAVPVAVLAVGGKLLLQGGDGGFGQVVGADHRDVIVRVGGKEVLSDKAVRHERTGNAEDEHPFQVVVPPVCPALPAAVLPLFAGLEVLGVDVAFVTVACHRILLLCVETGGKVLLFQCSQNALAHGVGQLLLLGLAHAGGLDGRHDLDTHAARAAAVAVCLKQGAGTGDSHRHHRGVGLDGNAESTGLELACAALFALVAGALGEDDEAAATLHDGGGIVQCPHRGAHIVTLHEHAAQQLHPAVEQGNLFQLLLGKDAVGLFQPGQQQGDVVVAAVVRHKHAGAVFGDVFQPVHGQGNAGHLQDAPTPAGNMLIHDLLHGGGISGGCGALGAAQDAVMQDHVSEQINEHRNGAKNAHDSFLLFAKSAIVIVAHFPQKRER